MKKLLSLLILGSVMLLGLGCATKTPFIEAKVSNDKATLYVYRKFNGFDMSSAYRLYINDKLVKDSLMGDGYMPFSVDAGKVNVRVYRDIINQHTLTLDAQAGRSYFIACESSADTGAFDMMLQSADIAGREITSTYYYTEAKKSEYFPSFEDSKEENNTKKETRSDSDEIQRLFEMKEKGIITEDEFATLKAKVLSK
ncbi:MAG: SHOCT domain-containing protein [Epsilonproteobacteria bacterium]|nr:SHOCT domain-containing protein [Campylobacterota bacterium]